ncbi:MAG: hypothetical protein WC517_01020, partial [Patescibacteria group bacterium]
MTGFIFKSKKLLLLLGDIGCLYLALYLTLVLRYWGNFDPASWPTHVTAFLSIFIVWLLVFYISDFYELKISYNNLALLTNYGRAIIINGIIAVLLFYFLAPLFPSIKPQRVLIYDLAITFVLLFAWRKIFYGLIKSPQIANHVLIIGDNPLAEELLEEIKK